jgi:hypothetical protein
VELVGANVRGVGTSVLALSRRRATAGRGPPTLSDATLQKIAVDVGSEARHLTRRELWTSALAFRGVVELIRTDRRGVRA